MGYDTTTLDRLGKTRVRLRAQLADVETALAEEVPRARAGGVTRAYVMRVTEYAGSWVDKLVRRAGSAGAPAGD